MGSFWRVTVVVRDGCSVDAGEEFLLDYGDRFRSSKGTREVDTIRLPHDSPNEDGDECSSAGTPPSLLDIDDLGS